MVNPKWGVLSDCLAELLANHVFLVSLRGLPDHLRGLSAYEYFDK